MDIIPLLLKEMEAEAQTTRKMLERVPEGNWDWKPHEKSMNLQQLTVHIAELPSWVTMALNSDGLDFGAMPYEPTILNSKEQLLKIFEDAFQSGMASLKAAKEEDMLPTWTLRTGEQVHAVMTKYEVIRHALSQTIHHRAQLGVDLRLLNIPIPGSYGPSADEMDF